MAAGVFVISQTECGVSSSDSRLVCTSGHSLGEYSALVFAKALSLADAVRLVVRASSTLSAPVVSICSPCQDVGSGTLTVPSLLPVCRPNHSPLVT